jgi:hypothetical protein
MVEPRGMTSLWMKSWVVLSFWLRAYMIGGGSTGPIFHLNPGICLTNKKSTENLS